MNTQRMGGMVLVAVLGVGGYMYLMPANDAMMEEATVMTKEESMGNDSMKNDERGETMMQKDESEMQQIKDMQSDAMKDDNMSADTMMMHGGTYESHAPEKIAFAEQGKVVLFFRAAWCPTCKTLDADIRAKLSSIPKDVTILDVSYDTATALKQKYGVTYQHTLVQVDVSGNQITKWSGSPTLAAVLSNVK